jgi:drug/metabolite transporter (DMT)-like permease
MSSTALLLILLSAFLHAGWNVLMKGVEERFFLMVSIHIFMVAALTPFLAVPAASHLLSNPDILIPLSGAAMFFALYHLFLAIGYGSGDMTIVYPITTMAPALVPLWGRLFLGERLSGAGVAGIALILFGVYSIGLRSFSLRRVLEPLRRFDPALWPALAAAFFYSLGSVADKAGIMKAEVMVYSYMLMVAMVLVEVPMAAGMAPGLGKFIVKRWKYVISASGILMASFLSYRFGLKVTDVSYAASVRQVNALFGVLLGLLVFREPFGRYRLAAASLITAGVIVIKIYG